MGWRLVREVLDGCPDLPYREFRLLVALALDARDATRQGMPGQEQMAMQCNCGLRTAKRAMRGLTGRGLVKVVRRSAPGVRAIYEILPVLGGAVDNPPTGDTSLSPERVSDPGQRVSDPGQTGVTEVAPTQSSSLVTISSHRARAVDIVAAALGLAAEDATEIVRRIDAGHHPGNLARYVRALAERDDLRRFLTCARPDGGRMSAACSAGDGGRCDRGPEDGGWCDCRHHPGAAS